ncbi:MAG: hypothetical protein K2X91_11480, partial [Thermoleophilia bacterium]|nr:hypothetical protein [Thermoleophilia bacterium]
PSGFERIAPGDPRIHPARVFAIRRPAPDPLVASGIRGLERLQLTAPPGRVRVTLWTEDPGEWELLPHPLQRRIRANGVTLVDETLSPRAWIAERYLAGGNTEHGAADDAWTAYGRYRGGRVGAEVEVGPDGMLTIELAGNTAEALHLSAVVIEPAQSTAGVEAVEALRALWYRSRWPVAAAPAADAVDAFTLPADPAAFAPAPVKLTAAPGTGARARIAVRAEVPVAHPSVALAGPETAAITGRVWAGQWRLERRYAGSTVLTLEDNMLSTDTARPIGPDLVRNYELWLTVPETGPAGRHVARLTIAADAAHYEIPIEIEVLPVVLPRAEKPAGFYLDEAPHLTWFDGMPDARGRQTACDLSLMASFGLDGGAPALATPDAGRKTFLAD